MCEGGLKKHPFSLCLLHFLLKSATNFVGEFKILLHFLLESATDLAPPSRGNRGAKFWNLLHFSLKSATIPQHPSSRFSKRLRRPQQISKFTFDQIFNRPYPLPQRGTQPTGTYFFIVKFYMLQKIFLFLPKNFLDLSAPYQS